MGVEPKRAVLILIEMIGENCPKIAIKQPIYTFDGL
jgi:hypothetical protein